MTQRTSAPSIPGETRHLPELDGIRGIAIFAVLLSHGVNFLRVIPAETTWGRLADRALLPLWGGVDLFFTLSGFLITGILLRTREQPTYFSSFYARRALRIFPVYYAFLVVQLALGLVLHPFHRFLPPTLQERISYFFYVQNWPVFWASWAGMPGAFGIYWSLAVEEQFYLVWPAVIRFLNLRLLFVLCLFGFALGWVERYAMIQHLGLQFGLMQWPFSRLDGLFLGAALALYQQLAGRRVPLALATSIFGAGAVLYVSVAVLHPEELQGAGRHLWTTGVSAFALMSAGLIAAAQHRPPWLHRALTLRPLITAGTYSYGMYVYHLVLYTIIGTAVSRYINPAFHDRPNPAVSFAVIAAAILATMGIAAVSFQLFERPILSLKRYFPSAAAPV